MSEIPSGWRYWLSWLSPIPMVWIWHTMFDGTFVCRCQHSAEYRNRDWWT